MTTDVTQERLKEVLKYDPITGEFTWTVNIMCMGAKGLGERAGGTDERGYRRIRIDGKLYKEHRLAWLYMVGTFPKDQIDHTNCIKGDNRFKNLREATCRQNSMNRKIRKNNATGLKGVSAKNQGFQAQIGHENKVYYLGVFPTKETAHQAYCKKATELQGEFANFGE